MCTNRENIPSEISLLRRKISNYEEKERRLLRIQPFISIAHNLENDELPKQHEMYRYANEELTRVQQKKKSFEVELNILRENLRSASDNKVFIFCNKLCYLRAPNVFVLYVCNKINILYITFFFFKIL